MKRIFLALAAIITTGILVITSACAGTNSTQAPGATKTVTATAAATKPAATVSTVIDSNYSVKIGFPTLVKDMLAPDGPDVWAVSKGLFDQEFSKDGIKVQYLPFPGAAPAINEALGAGSLDLAVIADIGALIGKAGGLKTSLVAMANPGGSPWWLIVSKASNATKVSDLKGKKVATVKGTLPHFYLLQALKANGLKPTDIELINMTGPDAEQALRNNQIDATVTGGWKSQQLLKDGFNAVDSTVQTPIGRGTMVIVATEGFISAHPTFFPRFYKVRAQAADWAGANREAALDILAKSAGGVDRSLIDPLWPSFEFDQSLSQEVLTRVKEGEQFLRDLALTRNAVDVDLWINKKVAYQKP